MNVERPDYEFMVLLALIVGGWFVLGVLVIGVLNLAKWMVRSTSTGCQPATATGGSWPGATSGRSEPSPMPPPFAGTAAAARQDGLVQPLAPPRSGYGL